MSQHTPSSEERPHIPVAGVVYGDTIYWITIAATVIVIIGSVISFVTNNTYIDPTYMLSSIWEGKTVDEIWVGAVGAAPNGHWYLSKLATGNGLTAFGIALGVFSVIPAILAAGYVLFREKQVLFAILALVAALITTWAMIA
ncbi:MAG: DUF1634 domain-containing protein [Gammaproteobacteria bacterium]|nr:DUF1634 domain-containing protein [Gammaproteobacteria bacterium]MDH5728259.1 DUF1634 domain-containing protein [Gammaproteobacteria bacterium]